MHLVNTSINQVSIDINLHVKTVLAQQFIFIIIDNFNVNRINVF